MKVRIKKFPTIYTRIKPKNCKLILGRDNMNTSTPQHINTSSVPEMFYRDAVIDQLLQGIDAHLQMDLDKILRYR
jgi:hypothetical protein